LIKKYFREKTYYIDLSDLWNEVSLLSEIPLINQQMCDIVSQILLFQCLVQIALQTSLGQMLDLISTHNGVDELAKYNIEGYAICLIL
jgi:farnesyl diphosphate synthase